MNIVKKIRYQISGLLNKNVSKIIPNIAIYGIGKEKLSKNSKKALVIYNIAALFKYVNGNLDKFVNINNHSMYWETAEIVRLLNEAGYLVDYFDFSNPPKIDWLKYDLIIDCFDYLKYCPEKTGQTKIFYSTGMHWSYHNLAELKRIDEFYKRNGIKIPPNRQILEFESDKYSNYMTFFGNESQLYGFDLKTQKKQLNISSTYIPLFVPKKINEARNNFIWFGGGGLIHKGLDLTVEAFCQLPQINLHIVGYPQGEPEFWEWLKPILSKNKNIKLYGWMNVASKEFSDLANKCIGAIYPSVAEGGPGSIAQLLHFGVFPIVMSSSNVRSEKTGFLINGDKDTEIINSIINIINQINVASEADLMEKSDLAREFGKKYHTREAYSQSFNSLLKEII